MTKVQIKSEIERLQGLTDNEINRKKIAALETQLQTITEGTTVSNLTFEKFIDSFNKSQNVKLPFVQPQLMTAEEIEFIKTLDPSKFAPRVSINGTSVPKSGTHSGNVYLCERYKTVKNGLISFNTKVGFKLSEQTELFKFVNVEKDKNKKADFVLQSLGMGSKVVFTVYGELLDLQNEQYISVSFTNGQGTIESSVNSVFSLPTI